MIIAENINLDDNQLRKLLEYNPQIELKRCTRCVLPETFPFIEFDANHFDHESKIEKLLKLTSGHPFLYFFDEGRGKIKKINSQEVYGLKLCNNLMFSKFEINSDALLNEFKLVICKVELLLIEFNIA